MVKYKKTHLQPLKTTAERTSETPTVLTGASSDVTQGKITNFSLEVTAGLSSLPPTIYYSNYTLRALLFSMFSFFGCSKHDFNRNPPVGCPCPRRCWARVLSDPWRSLWSSPALGLWDRLLDPLAVGLGRHLRTSKGKEGSHTTQ